MSSFRLRFRLLLPFLAAAWPVWMFASAAAADSPALASYKSVSDDQGRKIEAECFFSGNDCYAIRRSFSISDGSPGSLFTDLYFQGNLLMRVDEYNSLYQAPYLRVPGGLTLTYSMGHVSLLKDGGRLRAWKEDDRKWRCVPQEDPDRANTGSRPAPGALLDGRFYEPALPTLESLPADVKKTTAGELDLYWTAKSGSIRDHTLDSSTQFLFHHGQCVGTLETVSDRRMHVPMPRVTFRLYFLGRFLAEIDPESFKVAVAMIPEGYEFEKNRSTFVVRKAGVFMAGWAIDPPALLQQGEKYRYRLNYMDQALPAPDPEFVDMTQWTPFRLKAPTLEEAQASMTAVKGE